MAGLLQLISAQNNDPLYWIYRLHPLAALNADKTGGECPAECDCPPTFPVAMYCNNRNLKQIPYIPSRIKYVYLQHNQISTVSDKAFGNATNLIWIMLHENQIENIENGAFTNLVNLERLYLSGNNLTEVPANLPNSLRDLRLNHNRISKVAPDALVGMANLTLLLLNDNSIQDIDGSLKNLNSLVLLNAASNQLKKIPTGLPEMLHQLYLDSNSIDSIPENYFNPLSNLQYVRLSHNALTDKGIPSNAFNVSGLIELDLSFNKLERIPPVSASLQYLYLQANSIKGMYVLGFVKT